MKRFILISILIATATASADTLPARKPGLWQIETSSPAGAGMPAQTMKQCIDAQTDQKMMQMSSDVAGQMGAKCVKQSIEKNGSDYVAESDCTYNGVQMVSKATYSGDFNAAYGADMSVTYNPPLMGMSSVQMKMAAKWSGDCGTLKPGDVVMANGMTINMNNPSALTGGAIPK